MGIATTNDHAHIPVVRGPNRARCVRSLRPTANGFGSHPVPSRTHRYRHHERSGVVRIAGNMTYPQKHAKEALSLRHASDASRHPTYPWPTGVTTRSRVFSGKPDFLPSADASCPFQRSRVAQHSPEVPQGKACRRGTCVSAPIGANCAACCRCGATCGSSASPPRHPLRGVTWRSRSPSSRLRRRLRQRPPDGRSAGPDRRLAARR